MTVIDTAAPTVRSIPDDELVRRAVRSARSRNYRKGVKHPRWVAVMDLFGLGSTFSHELCRRYGLDPNEEVKS